MCYTFSVVLGPFLRVWGSTMGKRFGGLVMTDRTGQHLGNYRLVHLLGQGGFAEVYLGEHLQLGTQVAIKILQTQVANEEVEIFRREARTLAHLVHPHIVRVFDFGVEGTTPFLVMDYAPNGTLRKRHPKGVPLALPTIVGYVKQIADALQYAHDEHLIHRDVKPENLLLGRRNEVLLGDFGIALLAQSSRSQSIQDVAGTATYMAPEQFQGKPRQASDQYALGVIVYEWLCGACPFHGSFTEIASQHLFVPPPPLQGKIPAIPPAIEEVVMRALVKDPKQRFATVAAFANALEQASQGFFEKAYVPTQKPPSVDAPPLLSQSVIPTELITPPGQAPQSSELVTPPGQQFPPERLTPAYQANLPLERVTTSGKESSTVPATPANQFSDAPRERSLPNVLLSASTSTPSLSQFPAPSVVSQPRQRGISRRSMLLGLGGLAIVGMVGSGIAWLTHNPPVASLTTTPHPTTPIAHRPTISVTPRPALGTTLLTYPDQSSIHSREVFAIAWSSDSKRVASGGTEGVQVWDAATGETISTYRGHSTSVDIAVPAVNAVAWSPKGKLIASAGRDATVQVWDGTTGGHKLTYRGHSASQWVNGVAWSPDGTRIVSGSGDKTARVWDAATGNTLLTYQGHANASYGVHAVAWSPDGGRIASAGDDNVQVWDAATGHLLATYDAGAYGAHAVAWSPDGKRIAAGCADDTARVWNATTGNPLTTYRGHQGGVLAVTWSAESKRIASASKDFDVQMWDATTGKQIYSYGPTDVVSAVAWSPDGIRIASGDYGLVHVWQAV